MRITIIILSLLSGFMGVSQETLSGKYCTESYGRSDVVCIEFQQKQRFVYTVSGPMGAVSSGYGDYEYKNQTLRLFFDRKSQRMRSSAEVIKRESIYPKDVKIKFDIRDERGQILEASVHREDDVIEYLTEGENTTVWVKKDFPSAIYHIRFFGYEPIAVTLNHHYDQEVRVMLVPVQPKTLSEETMIFKLTNLTKDGFSTGINLWDHFFKVKQEE